MIIYNLFLLSDLASGYIYKNKKTFKIVIKILFAILIILSALRSINIGNDTVTYHQLFINVSNTPFESLSDIYSLRWEMGFIYLIKILSYISSSPQIIIVVSSIFIYITLYKFVYSYSNNIVLSIFLFMTMRYYFFFLSNIRQSIAICIILIAFDLLNKDKLVLSVFTVILAYLFHTTSIVFLVVIAFKKIKYTNRKMGLILLFSIIIFAFFNQLYDFINLFFPIKYQNYVNTSYFLESDNLANTLNCIIFFLIFLFCHFFYKRNNNTELVKSNNFNLLFPLLSFVFSLIAIKFGMATRIQYYFSIFLIVIIPNIITQLTISRNKKIINIVIICSFFLYHILILLFKPEWQHVYPYEVFF